MTIFLFVRCVPTFGYNPFSGIGGGVGGWERWSITANGKQIKVMTNASGLSTPGLKSRALESEGYQEGSES